jgi:hypothetical protein
MYSILEYMEFLHMFLSPWHSEWSKLCVYMLQYIQIKQVNDDNIPKLIVIFMCLVYYADKCE